MRVWSFVLCFVMLCVNFGTIDAHTRWKQPTAVLGGLMCKQTIRILTAGVFIIGCAAPVWAQDAAGCVTSKCHAEIGTKAWVHGPVGAGICTVCHTPATGKKHEFTFAAEKEELCWTCHDPEDFEGAVVHGPFAAGFCQACHDPHRSKFEYLLVSDKTDLCESCHEQYDMAAIPEHGSGEDRLCQSCHDPHAAERKYMLKGNEESS